MSKVIPFKERFRGQIQNMGKGGILGTQTEEPIKNDVAMKQQYQFFQQPINTTNDSSSSKNKYEENSFLKQGRPQDLNTKMANNGTFIIDKLSNQPSQLYPQHLMNMNTPPINPYMNQMNNPYTNKMILIPNMTFGQNPYMLQPNQQTQYMLYANQPQIPIYNYMAINNQQFLPNQSDLSQYSVVNQTSVQPKVKLRPISSQNRTTDASKIENTSLTTNRNNSSNRITSANNSTRYIKGDYKPYTLKEYKELEKAGIVLGGLGPNIGTKDWEEKKGKMKKMEQYSNQVNSLSKQTKKKKESLDELVQKEKLKKIESSNRKKCYEYGKLVRPKSRIGSTIDYYDTPLFKDLGIINEKQNDLIKDKLPQNEKIVLNYNPPIGKENKIKTNMYCDLSNNEESNNLCFDESDKIIFPNNDENDQSFDIERICRERENYKAKIESIKETLMN